MPITKGPMAAFAASPRLESVAWSVQVRGEQVEDRIVAMAGDRGLHQRRVLPFMLKVLDVMDHVSMRAYLVEVEGVPVATSFGVLVDDLVGVFNIAVPPPYRRRGYGRAATAAVLRAAYEEGARTAFLHASPLGAPLYQVMGFRRTENWTLFTA
jgi:GNAT superfamily N-acetyltransferase